MKLTHGLNVCLCHLRHFCRGDAAGCEVNAKRAQQAVRTLTGRYQQIPAKWGNYLK